jgi:hypothetical protein
MPAAPLPPAATLALRDLVAQIRAGQAVDVVWSVHPEIGPGWIGGGRSVSMSLDGQALPVSVPVHQALWAVLIVRLAIPAESPETVLCGEGTLRIAGDLLVVDYTWSDTPMYEDGHSGEATVALWNWRLETAPVS